VILSVIKTFADKEDDWWNNVELAVQASIKRGQKEEKEGKLIPNDEVMKKYEQ
jgi:predicted transcriptional regulator